MDNYLTIKNFKCFTDIQIPLRRLTVLAGGNSAGKSSVIQCILLLRSAIWNEKVGINRVMLNGDYLLRLGNSFDIISKNASSNLISITFQYGERDTRQVVFEADSKEAQVFLTIKEFQSPTKLEDITGNHALYKSIHYLNAERLGPRPYYQVTDQGKNVGWQGEHAISLLSSTAAETNEYDVAAQKMHPGSKNPRLRAQVEAWMSEIVPGLSINAQKISEINQAYVKYGNSLPQNVGFGISYVLPIVVSGLIAGKNEMFIVENPEAHLHPSGQSRIGKYLAQVAAFGTNVIIETHSEHVINGIRIASLADIISNRDVLVNFFTKEENNQIVIKSIDINDAGDLTSYPRGFFDQQQRDFAEIVKHKRSVK